MRGVIAWFAGNHVAANLLLFLLVISGLLAMNTMPQKTFPDIDVPLITVSVLYLGAAPEEVEEGVCIRIEEELEGIEGVKEIRSTANEGSCSVQVEMFEDADEATALDDVKNRVDAIDTFPEETEKPIITLVSPQRSVMDIAITGPQDERTLKILGQQVRDDIASLPGVTQVELLNTRPYEISIEVSEESLRRNGLTFDELAQAVRVNSLDLPGGSIKTTGGEVLLRTKGQAYWGDEFERIVIRTAPDGTRLYLGDVATVVDGFEDTDQSLRFNRQPAALVRVLRVGNQDVLEITALVYEYLRTSSARVPKGVQLTVWNDNSVQLEDRLSTLLDSARQGFLMVLILLALFLRPRLAFWVSVGVPVAFLGALFLISVLGLSIDGISLFGFILVLGILVDDAIVVGENVHTHQQREGHLLRGAILGTQQVSVPVIFGVLTTIAAFTPILFNVGTIGQVMGVIATTVICCLIFSLIESQLVLPAHLAHTNVNTETGEVGLLMIPVVGILMLEFAWDVRSWIGLFVGVFSALYLLHLIGISRPIAARIIAVQKRFSEGLANVIQRDFKRLVEAAVANRYITLSIAFIALSSAIGIVGSGRLPFSFFPPLESDQVIARLTMPLGTPARVTNEAIKGLEASAFRMKEQLAIEYPESPPVSHLLAAIGSHPSTSSGGPGPPGAGSGAAASHLGEVIMQLTPSQTRPQLETRDVANLWRDANGPIADAVELKFQTALFTVGNAIDIQLAGTNVEELREVAERLRVKLAEYPGVIDISDSFRAGKQELKLNILPAGEAAGLTLGQLARQVRQAFYGEEVQRIQRGRDEVRVMVRYTENERRTLGTLDRMRIRTPDGAEVPFTTVAEADLGRGFSSIKRASRRRVVNVTADVDRTQITANEVIADLRAGAINEILDDYPRVTYSLEGEQRQQGESTGALIPLFGVALFVIFALLAIPLGSYSQPLIIMSVIPFAFVGAIWGHAFMKMFDIVSGIAMMSVMGFVAASGVVVNSSLVLVHNVNSRRELGEPMLDAVLHAAVSRCRPILLTSLTTFVGLAPLMLNRSVQAQFLVPMAVSLAFGVLFATAVTLLVVPSAYMVLEDLRQRLGGASPVEDEIPEPLPEPGSGAGS